MYFLVKWWRKYEDRDFQTSARRLCYTPFAGDDRHEIPQHLPAIIADFMDGCIDI